MFYLQIWYIIHCKIVVLFKTEDIKTELLSRMDKYSNLLIAARKSVSPMIKMSKINLVVNFHN